MKRVFLLAAIAAVAAGAFLLGYGYGRWYGPSRTPAAVEKKTGYHCPMHPTFRSDKPGDCGICGMKLVPDEAPPENSRGRVLYYRDPHAPEYRSDKPGLNPETGNELQAVYAGDIGSAIHVPAEKQSWIGIRLGEARMTPYSQTVRAVGRVAIDETSVVRVTSRADGWVEKVTADFVGQQVNKGDTMLSIYSPELVASQQEYLLALKAERELERSDSTAVHQHSRSLVDSARRRLEMHWGLSPSEIVQLTLSQAPQRSFALRAPSSGVIVERKAFPNQRVTTDTELYTLADLRRVWIMAEVQESDAHLIREGMSAALEPASAPGRRFTAKVSYIQPQVETQTRTLKVRLESDNRDLFLKPEAFVNVEFALGGGQRLTVPEEAVLDSGMKQTVFVAVDNAHFAPREVKTGARIQGRVEIVSGLKAGEKIAVSGAFLLDSESQMRAPAGEAHAHD